LAIGKVYLTKRGRNLIAKGAACQQIRFTGFAIGDGSLTGQAIEDMNSLMGYKQTVIIGRKQVKDTGILKLSGNLSNSERGGFYYRELGLFATDPDLGEILYAYGNAGTMAEYIPLFQEEVYEKTIILNVYHGNAENVTAVIDESLIFATKTEIEEICLLLEGKAEKDLSNVTTESFRTAFASSGLGTEVADKTTLDEVKNKIGATTDTGGTAITGGIFAKLNAILQQFMSNWTAVRAAKLDQLDVAVSSRADKITLDNVNTKAVDIQSRIGVTNAVPSGSATIGTVFGKINWILENWTKARAEKLDRLDVAASSRASAEDLKKINSNLAKPLDTLMNEITSSTWDRMFEINNLVNTLKTGTIPIVKSIQRGFVIFQNEYDTTITISDVNPQKTLVLLDNNLLFSGQSSGGDVYGAILVSLTSTSIVLKSHYHRNTSGGITGKTASYQVIEFY